MFSLFLKKPADLDSLKLAKIFSALLTFGSFPESWKVANVTPSPKDNNHAQFSLEYRPISLFKLYLKYS